MKRYFSRSRTLELEPHHKIVYCPIKNRIHPIDRETEKQESYSIKLVVNCADNVVHKHFSKLSVSAFQSRKWGVYSLSHRQHLSIALRGVDGDARVVPMKLGEMDNFCVCPQLRKLDLVSHFSTWGINPPPTRFFFFLVGADQIIVNWFLFEGFYGLLSEPNSSIDMKLIPCKYQTEKLLLLTSNVLRV